MQIMMPNTSHQVCQDVGNGSDRSESSHNSRRMRRPWGKLFLVPGSIQIPGNLSLHSARVRLWESDAVPFPAGTRDGNETIRSWIMDSNRRGGNQDDRSTSRWFVPARPIARRDSVEARVENKRKYSRCGKIRERVIRGWCGLSLVSRVWGAGDCFHRTNPTLDAHRVQ